MDFNEHELWKIKYSKSANLINILFIAFIVIAPISYSLYDLTTPFELGREIILLAIILGTFVFADWYHFYMTNSFRGILNSITLGLSVGLISILIATALSSATVLEIALFKNASDWEQMGWLLRAYFVAVGLVCTSIVSLPRLWFISLICKGKLPQ
jgi:hypothetical protein